MYLYEYEYMFFLPLYYDHKYVHAHRLDSFSFQALLVRAKGGGDGGDAFGKFLSFANYRKNPKITPRGHTPLS